MRQKSMKTAKEKRVTKTYRLLMAALAVCLFLAELLIGLYGKGFVRAYLGDVLILPFLYCVIRIFVTRQDFLLPAGLFLMGAGAEVLQYLDICGWIGVDRHSLLGILLGSTGDVMDVACYGVGVLLICLTQHYLERRQSDGRTAKR